MTVQAQSAVDATPDFLQMENTRDRIATRCVCCGSAALQSSPAILMPFVAHRTFAWAPVVLDESWGLKTIAPGHAYSICNSLGCQQCGLVSLDMRFSDAELSRLYDKYREEDYNALRDTYEPGYRLRNESLTGGINYLADVEKFLLPHLTQPLSVLDWGGDTGKNTPFRSRDLTVDVYDISNKPVESGARAVTKETAVAGKYGLVVLSNVLEHVPYPGDPLHEIRQVMDEMSILYVEVPFEDVMRSGLEHPHQAKKHWHEHINFFSRRSLESLLSNCGYETIAVNEIFVHSGGKSASLLQLACRLKSAAAATT